MELDYARERLYDAVWAEPAARVAARYRLRLVDLERLCRALALPRPRSGHWSKARHGKQPMKPPLPPAPAGLEKLISPALLASLLWHSGSRTGAPDVKHPLLIQFLQHYEPSWDSNYGYLKPKHRRLPDIFATRDCLERATDFADALFKALEARGHEVTLLTSRNARRDDLDTREVVLGETSPYKGDWWCPRWPTVVLVGTVAVGLTIYEISEETDVVRDALRDLPPEVDGVFIERVLRSSYPVTARDYRPCGRLGLRVYSPYADARWETHWREDAPGAFKTQVAELADRIERLAQPPEGAPNTARHRVKEISRRESARELFDLVGHWLATQNAEVFLQAMEREARSLPASDREIVRGRLAIARGLLSEPAAFERLRLWKLPDER